MQTLQANPLPETRPLRWVLDTNVVMALWHFGDTKLAHLKSVIDSGSVRLLTRPACLDELRRVLAYTQFDIAPARQEAIMEAYLACVHCVAEPSEAELAAAALLPRCGDRDDQKFIELACDAGAHVLVSRDKLVLKLARRRELRDRLQILTPERLQALLEASGQAA